MGRDNSCLQCLEQQQDVGQFDLQGLLLSLQPAKH